MPKFHNILIVRTDRIGDVILTTPAIRALRKAYPQARLTILVSSATRVLVDGNPYLDEVIVDDRKKEHKDPLGFLRLIWLLRKKRFDLSVDFHTKKRTNLLCFWAGIPYRLGYCNTKFGFLLTHKIPDTRPQGAKHETQYCLDVLRAIGVNTSSLELFLPLRKDAEEWAQEYFTKNQLDSGERIVAVHPQASCPTKKWPAKCFAGLINQIREHYGCRIILIGSDNTVKTSGNDVPASPGRETAKEIISMLQGPVLDLTGKTTVAQLASLLKRCHALVSNDSGPVHVADAVGTPVVSIFTRNQPGINAERWKPLSEKSRVVTVPPQQDISFAKGKVHDPKYLEIIQVKEVLEAVDAIFKLC